MTCKARTQRWPSRLNWIEQRLVEDGSTIETLVQAGNQGQAADQVTLGNSIGSLRFLSSVDWRGFVESMSVVDGLLREDPVGAYASMDFGTRNQYRVVIERIARRSEQTEPQVATTALQLAQRRRRRSCGAGDENPVREAHVGLLPDRSWPPRAGTSDRVPSAAVGQCARLRFAASRCWRTSGRSLSSPQRCRLSGVDRARKWAGRLAPVRFSSSLAVIGTSQLAVTIVNWIATHARDAACAAAHEFLERHSAEVARAGGRANAAQQHRQYRRSGRGARSPVSSPIATTTCASAC